MSNPEREHDVVLRHTVFVPAAVRLPRGPATGATDSAPPEPDAAPAEDPEVHLHAAAREEGFRIGHEEGLRSGSEAGQRAGYEEGLRRGTAAARIPLEERARQMDGLLAGMADAAHEAWTGADEDVLALCYETLCRVVGEAACTPESVRPQVERLLAASELQGSITLHLHPADVRLLDEARAEGRLPTVAGRAVRWRPDPRVVLGGCVLAGTGGGIDARLETVLEQCKAGLLLARSARAAARAGIEVAK
ncbi:MAG TPA: FliH/SctL family protein [Ramlibacter sp.]|jgi:flagellar assembly protein FliH